MIILLTLAGLIVSLPVNKCNKTSTISSNSSIDPLDIHNPCRSIEKKLKSLGLGIGDHLKDSAEGVKEVFTDPIGTGKRIGNVIRHPVKTVKNAYKYFTKPCEDEMRCTGEKIGFVVSTGISIAAGAGIGMLADAVADTSLIARTAALSRPILAETPIVAEEISVSSPIIADEAIVQSHAASVAAVKTIKATQNVVEYGTTVTGTGNIIIVSY